MLPFQPISQHYQNLFAQKVYKIPVVIADDCPNRRGLKGMQQCVFCDEWGSAARSEAFTFSLEEQITKYRDVIGKRFHATHFLVYFQAYTNTFLKLNSLRAHFQTALQFPFVRGLVVGTRPDCISQGVLDLWNETQSQTSVFVELGVQSFFTEQLQFLQRGHTAVESLRAIEKIARKTTVDIGIHLMFGLPNETSEQIVQTAKWCNELPITNVKLHNLHVLRNTPLHIQYLQGQFQPIEFPEYCERVRLFLQHLSPRIFVQRLAAYSSRWSELVAPDWTKDKIKTYQHIIDYLQSHNSFQGQHYVAPIPNAQMISSIV